MDSDSDSDSNNDEVFHSALDLLNEEDRAERAEYNAQVAEAWRIHNKYNSNPAEEDTDSELSVPASSPFNGMKGIEMGGISEAQGTEIGGTVGIEIGSTSGVQGTEIGGTVGIEMGSASEVQGNAGSNSTAFSGDGEVKVTRYGRVLRKRTK